MARGSPGRRAMAAWFKRARLLSWAGRWQAALPAASMPERELGCAASDPHRRLPARPAQAAPVEMHRLQPGRAAGDLAGMAAGAGEQHGDSHARRSERLNASCWSRSSAWSSCSRRVLLRLRHLQRRAGGRRAGAGRILEAEGLGEADLADQRHRRREVGLGLAGMADDEVGGQREVGPGRAQPVHQRAGSRPRCGRGSSPPAPGRSRTAPAGAGRASASGMSRCAAISVVVHVARMGGGVAQPRAGPGFRPVRRSSRPRPQVAAVRALAVPGIHVLAEQRDLARALRHQPPRLGEHGRGRAASIRRRGCRAPRRRSRTCRSPPGWSGRRSRPAARRPPAGGRTSPRPGSRSRSPRRRRALARATISGRRW